MKIVICGNYGASNIGDEAILDGILLMVRRGLVTAIDGSSRECNITVMSASPEDTKRRIHGGGGYPLGVSYSGSTQYDSVHFFPAGCRSFFRGIASGSIWKTIRAVRDADLFILGGGGLFQDERPMAIIIWSLQAWLARIYRVPIFCLGQSVGPLKTFFGRSVTASVFRKAKIITVRDNSSVAMLKGMEIGGVKLVADPAFALPSPEPFDERPEEYVVLSVRPWKGTEIARKNIEILNLFTKWLKEKHGLRTVLVPFHQEDIKELKEISEGEQYVFTSDYSAIIELMSRATAVIGMRLHSIIFATIAKCPFIALSYSQKVKSFVQTLDLEEYILDWNDLDLDDLKRKFSALMKNRGELTLATGDAGFVSRKRTLEHEDMLREFFK